MTTKALWTHTTGQGKEWRATVHRGTWPLYIGPVETTPEKAYEHARAFIQLLRNKDAQQ